MRYTLYGIIFISLTYLYLSFIVKATRDIDTNVKAFVNSYTEQDVGRSPY
jgi:hypothetical protein